MEPMEIMALKPSHQNLHDADAEIPIPVWWLNLMLLTLSMCSYVFPTIYLVDDSDVGM